MVSRKVCRHLAVVAAIFGSVHAFACCGAGPMGVAIHFHGQQNIIVWDDATKTEHFIRNASFQSSANDIGFIAPTPTIPQLEEVDGTAFRVLAQLEPVDWSKTLGMEGPAPQAGAGGIEVLQEVDVANYHAVTLRASDAEALSKWMKENGYHTTDQVKKWTDFYIRKNWVLTAFKVKMKGGTGSTGLVKMSFKTERPFNPYLVPAENAPDPNKRNPGLRLFFVSSTAVRAINGPASATLKPKWHAQVAGDNAESLKTSLKLDSLPRNAIVTTFVDRSFPNIDATDDLYFASNSIGGGANWVPLLGVVAGVCVVICVGMLMNHKRNPAIGELSEL